MGLTDPCRIASLGGAAAELDAARRLFAEYAAGLGIDLAYQGFAEELAGLPGKYAPPGGDLLLAWSDAGEALGCLGLRPLGQPGVCEIKRLYVRPPGRGLGLGRMLTREALVRARALGYREIVLDTLPWLTAAIAIYRGMGFAPIAAYMPGGVPGTLYFGRNLAME